jgi:hypothetical protein
MTPDEQNDPAVWLLLWDRGQRTGDFDLAAKAKRELERLGVRVSCRRMKTAKSNRRGNKTRD